MGVRGWSVITPTNGSPNQEQVNPNQQQESIGQQQVMTGREQVSIGRQHYGTSMKLLELTLRQIF